MPTAFLAIPCADLPATADPSARGGPGKNTGPALTPSSGRPPP